MPWPGVPLKLTYLLLLATLGLPGTLSERNVGCLFSERLCLENEWCYDDYAFGRCLSADVGDDDLYRYDLEREVLHEISRELRRLFALGYRWGHAYTQCRLQAILYAVKQDITFEDDTCAHLVDQDLEGALKAIETQDPLDPREVAIIKYTPSIEDPHAAFADEVYYPPVDDAQDEIREKILPSDAIDIMDMEDPYAHNVMKRNWIPQMHRRAPPRHTIPLDALEFLQQNNDYNELGEQDYPSEDFTISDEDYEKYANLLNQIESNQERFSEIYNTPDKFRAGWELRDYLEDSPESRIYYDENNGENEEYGSGYNYPQDGIFRELKNKANKPAKTIQSMPAIYTEGGTVYLTEDKDEADIKYLRDFEEFLKDYNAGFKRPERLDVKKPGPQYIFKHTTGNNEEEILPSMMKKEPRGAPHPIPSHDALFDDSQNEADFIYVQFENSIKTWKEGEYFIKNVSALLNIEPDEFSRGKVDSNLVSFKVHGFNATKIAEQIGLNKDQLNRTTGIRIKSVAIGNKLKKQTVVWEHLPDWSTIYTITLLVSAIVGAIVFASVLLLIIRKTLKSREKLRGIARPDSEASKDYQDLCRVRMATKGQVSDSVHGRITSLSRESEQSPSSRSSTSSWSEEPALHNMDISTGHMVLNYMEDHLKNKDRLEQEWVALCAYVAEPCETTIALKKENVDKNRYPEIVPYDHSRVVLNELSNAAGSDYINASSITDHDPRNPAYIATQGPLPQTAPDFWQLIWEQGAVVIVMLTRLTEGGTAMCHRYWPEEGFELYHIYEVHLVSEHIWCDDYLVRSFYLKNIRTGETRTVTQFHFLSWPENTVPASTKALLEFRRKVNKSYRGRSCPIVVHCSDGAGRTGTYCLIDMVLSRMAKGAKEIDIAATLEHLRDQRLRMVASKQQFEFVLTAVAEEVHAILKALPPQPTTQSESKETK